MKKTILRVLAFLPAAVLLLAAAASACEHYPDEVSEAELIPSGYAEPGVGVPGYTGDLLCPVCGEVCIPGKTIPAKQPEAPHPASNDGETETPPKPQPKPEPQPEHEPQGTQDGPEAPSDSGGVTYAEPGTNDTPAASSPSAIPVAPAVQAPAAQTSASGYSRPASTSSSGRTSGKAGSGKKQEEPKAELPEGRFSYRFPYRRVRLRPAEGIRAEAAGDLIWPVPRSPFQTLWGD